jgi:hypothetical protein
MLPQIRKQGKDIEYGVKIFPNTVKTTAREKEVGCSVVDFD